MKIYFPLLILLLYRTYITPKKFDQFIFKGDRKLLRDEIQ